MALLTEQRKEAQAAEAEAPGVLAAMPQGPQGEQQVSRMEALAEAAPQQAPLLPSSVVEVEEALEQLLTPLAQQVVLRLMGLVVAVVEVQGLEQVELEENR